MHAYAQSADAAPPPEAIDFFETKIRPVLSAHCYDCHSGESDPIEGGLLLDSREGTLRGGNGGSVVTPGDPAHSRLLTAIRHQDDDLKMPPDGQLPEDVVKDFERWIATGLVDPRIGPALPATRIVDRANQHWAFQPITSPEIRHLENDAWSRSNLDRTVRNHQKDNHLAPQSDAPVRSLARRLYYDLTGLPPSYDQLQQFYGDPPIDRYEALVDRLIASPQFGERWARYWLDVARFADTKGYVFTEDRNYPRAFLYRDWVIKAINDDMPVDTFLRYQLAADLIVDTHDREQRQHLNALGYLTLGRRFINNIHDIIDDRIDVVMRGTLGLTAACARCHDHKYDPISSADYYALYGIFASSEDKQDDDTSLYVVDKSQPQNSRLFLRGSPHNQGDEVPRRFPEFFAARFGDHHPTAFQQGSGRLALADKICDPQNPLTARVMVNRVWLHLMGQPLVRTPSDFGLRTDEPALRDTLDYLAAQLIRNGWSLKMLVREIVTSSVYRQSSYVTAEALERDPENDYCSHYPVRRLDFEAMRDSMLLVSGQLDATVGGPSAHVEEPQTRRRTLYAFIDRQNLPGLFRVFDFASPDTHSPSRPETAVPQQALFLMNNPFVQDMAVAAAAQTESIDSVDQRISALYRRILARVPSEQELSLAHDYINGIRDEESHDPESAVLTSWQRLAQVLMCSNEFLFTD
ncbi:MAG: PSD1 and planctomycete cytochrome C domain-containing protein [Pirellulaceae bacterium]